MKQDITACERILLLDGAMGTMIQEYGLSEADFRGQRFADWAFAMKGNNDVLSIVRPDVVKAVHCAYLDAGSDIIETNSFNSNAVSMADYGLVAEVRELNLAAARIAREAADEYIRRTPEKYRWVAGSVGPTTKSASISPDVSDPGGRSVGFDELEVAFGEQIDALIEGGVDVLLIETAYDTLNVKAALMAAERVMAARGVRLPIMLSFTIAGASGRLLSGQTLGAALASVAHVPLWSVGLNCSFGARDMKPYLKELRRLASCRVSAYPNAGLPNALGQYEEYAESMAMQVKEFLDEGLADVVGGCCGTTPAHIAAIGRMIEAGNYGLGSGENRLSESGDKDKTGEELVLSGLERLVVSPGNNFVNVGERCNVAGSKRFLRLIKEKDYEGAVEVARRQVEDGAQILDINMDDGLLDGAAEMVYFLRLIGSEPEIARIPVMVDSSDWGVIEAGLKCLQGKSVVNSISLKNGEAVFLEQAKRAREYYGSAVVAMAFDELGQADTYERKTEVCARMYDLLTKKAGYPPTDIIFDPNVLAIGTGMEEHDDYGRAFIRATSWIKKHLPGAKVSGGVSNLSYAFRGNNYLREAIHAVFLYHAIRAGMDMGIVNPGMGVTYEDIPPRLLELTEDLVLNRKKGAADRLIAYVAEEDSIIKETDKSDKKAEQWRSLPLDGRLKYALIKGIEGYLDVDLKEAIGVYAHPVDIIDQPLMRALSEVGRLFGEGKLFLPQVVKAARTMKKAVSILEPYIHTTREEASEKAGKILLATVKGDVHDIGKNITGLILACNNFEVIDIGVMVPTEEVVEKAIRHQVDLVALSGLITPSLQEMAFVASEMQRAGLDIPLMIGGATTSKLHTALRIAPLYDGIVVHVKDASQAAPTASRLLNPHTREAYAREIEAEYAALRERESNKAELVPLEYALRHRFSIDWESYQPMRPVAFEQSIEDRMGVGKLIPYINWKAFLAAWKLSSRSEEAESIVQEARDLLAQWAEKDSVEIRAIVGFYPVSVHEDLLLLIGDKQVAFLRQQEKREDDQYRSLIDFVKPEGDYVGLFAVSVAEREPEFPYPADSQDAYRDILSQVLRDRLAEAATEKLHEKVRKVYWGYSPDEDFTPEELLKAPYKGIRPASGYPTHPDLSLNFVIDELLSLDRIGISLTPNGAMNPTSSIVGMFIAHPASSYFRIGHIGDDQLEDYARKRRVSTEEVARWLGR